MASFKTKLATLLALMGICGAMPANAFVGRLGAHSAPTIRHFQEHVRAKSHPGRHIALHTSRRHGLLSRLLQHQHHRHRTASITASSRAAAGRSYMWAAPASASDASVLPDETKEQMQTAFFNGGAGEYSPASMLSSSVFVSSPLHGGVFKRHASIQFIILHSTETVREADAERVIKSWNGRGLRHPGAQFVVDRDGAIYCTADPTYGTTHVDQHRTKFGVTNDNSVGIEMVRTGEQEYTDDQMRSISCLVTYLQSRYAVDDKHILGHGMVQPSDRRDPVNFNWQAFESDKDMLKHTAYRP